MLLHPILSTYLSRIKGDQKKGELGYTREVAIAIQIAQYLESKPDNAWEAMQYLHKLNDMMGFKGTAGDAAPDSEADMQFIQDLLEGRESARETN